MTASDRLFLEAAVELATRGLYSAAPNPRVGCLLVRGGRVLGRGWHVRTGEGHAEVNALADAAAAGEDVRGATAFVSLEPCAFHGRTPACSRTLIDAGITRVVAAGADPHPRVQGAGFDELRAAGVEVVVHELDAARMLNEGVFNRYTRGLPFVRIKVAASLDGRTAMSSGESQWITGPAARSDVQHWRARSCAVLTGSGTVLADDPALTVREDRFATDGVIRQPLRVVVDRRGRVPDDARVFSGPGECLRVGAESGELPALLAELGRREINEVLVEAGPTLVGAFLEAGIWDELIVYLAPKLLGSDGRPLAELALVRMAEAISATMLDLERVGDDVRIRLRPAVSGPADPDA